MDELTLEALEGSIAKWEAIVAGTGVDEGTTNCPLCAMFYNESAPDEDGPSECFGCPIAEWSGETCCSGTPYSDWAFHVKQTQRDFPYRVMTERQRQLAQAELEFLRSLRPAGGPT